MILLQAFFKELPGAVWRPRTAKSRWATAWNLPSHLQVLYGPREKKKGREDPLTRLFPVPGTTARCMMAAAFFLLQEKKTLCVKDLNGSNWDTEGTVSLYRLKAMAQFVNQRKKKNQYFQQNKSKINNIDSPPPAEFVWLQPWVI